MTKPKIGLLPGDPSGIGPELVARLLTTEGVGDGADILLIGDQKVFEAGQAVADARFPFTLVDAEREDWNSREAFALHAMETIRPEEIEVAKVSEASGRSVLKTLDKALELTTSSVIDAFVFAPFNKAAMHLAGLGHDDELHYMAAKLSIKGYISELNTLDGIWTSRVTSHIPLREVAASINETNIQEAVYLIDRVLKCAGMTSPKISVAALNPHAGDNGNFGTEEIDIIKPAVKKLAETDLNIDGPWPSDTVFLKAVAKEIDAIVTMYHDQGQIALKLLGFDRGVTVQGGLPIPVTTPAHGTAFDIAGKGQADVSATLRAFEIACEMVTNWDY